MTIGRNATCPCGSGQKYKKCCLAKDEAAARAAEAERQAEAAARRAEEEAQRQEWEKQRQESSAARTEQPPDDPPEATAHELGWPPLSDAEQQVVDAWWKEVGPVYQGKDRGTQSGWLLERVLAFLEQHPRLFRYLYLHEEFLFELGGALARAERREDYLGLLRRLRHEQPEMYFECFGYYDEDLLTEALRTGRREDIPACLRLFQEHPAKHIDQFARVVDLLAWRGYETELKELLEPTAEKIACSPEVLGGEFGERWLTHLALFPFLEAGDASPAAVDRFFRATMGHGYLIHDADNRAWFTRAITMSSRSPAAAVEDLKHTRSDWFHNDVAWSFTGWLRRTKALTWTSARFLAEALINYWIWREEGKKSTSPFGLSKERLDHYLAQCCGDFFCLNGVRALSTLQGFHYFTEYLVAHDYFSSADALRLQDAAAAFFEPIRYSVDSSDSGYLICPTYEALIGAGD